MNLKNLMNQFIRNFLDSKNISHNGWTINTNSKQGFGEYSSNIALKLANELKKNPYKIAVEIAEFENEFGDIFHLSASQPGFVNFHINILSENLSKQIY